MASSPVLNCDASKYGLKLKQVDYHWIVRESWQCYRHIDHREPSVRTTRFDVLLPSDRGLHLPKEYNLPGDPYRFLLTRFGDRQHNFFPWSAFERLEVDSANNQVIAHLIPWPTEVFHGITWKKIHLAKVAMHFADPDELCELITCCEAANIIKVASPLGRIRRRWFCFPSRERDQDDEGRSTTPATVYKLKNWIRKRSTPDAAYQPGEAVCILSEEKQQSLVAKAQAKGESIHDFDTAFSKPAPTTAREGVTVTTLALKVFKL